MNNGAIEAKNAAAAQYAGNRIGGAYEHNPTVGENIDRRIAELEAQLEQLKASKETLAPLLNMKIGDLRQAMNY